MSVEIHELKTVRLALTSWPTRRRPDGSLRRRGRPAGDDAWPAAQLVNAGVYVGARRHAHPEES